MHPPLCPPRRAIVAAASAGVAALTPVAVLAATALPAAGAATATSAPPCATSGLVVWLDTQGNGAAGSNYYHLEFTNQSGSACMLGGYPGVSAVNLGGDQLGSAASRDKSRRPRTVRLASGATATTVLRIVEAGNFPRSACHQVSAAGLRVYPPNRTASKLIPFPFNACSRTGPVYLSVRAMQKAEGNIRREP
ncbi:MAG: DUF4232 domain-containing protein [Solirubrobacteraceae bacterium]